MKKLLQYIACTAFVAIPASSGHAADSAKEYPSQYYFQGSLGLNLQTEADNTGDNVIELNSDFEPGMNFAGALGVRLTRHIRTDIELSYRHNDANNVSSINSGVFSGVGGEADGEVTSLSAMANVYFEITGMSKEPKRLMPYVMGGVGFTRISADMSAGLDLVDDSTVVPAYQVGGGIGYYLTEKTKLDLGYRYFIADDPEFEDLEGDPFDSEYQNHTLMATLRYDL